MKHLRLTVSVDPDRAPAFFNLLANDPAVDEARVLDWNATAEETHTVLYAIDGDARPFREGATETPGIESVELSAVDRDRTYALVTARPHATPMFDAITEARARSGLVFRKPIIYRDSTIYCRAVGDPEPLQAALDRAPDAMAVRVDEIGTFRGDLERPDATLSDRQREAVAVALDLGYYDRPRGATHEEVAAELGCAPPTASDHLQKAEAKLVRAVMDEFGPAV